MRHLTRIMIGIALSHSVVTLAAPTTVPATLPASPPTLLGLSVEAQDAADAARQIGQQLGVPVTIGGDVGAVRHTATTRPYVAAVCGLLEQTRLTFSDSPGFVLTRGTPYQIVPLGETAAIVFTRVSMTARHLPAMPHSSWYGYSLYGTVLTDPALNVVGLSSDVLPDALDPATLCGGVGAFGSIAKGDHRPDFNGPPNMQFALHFNAPTRLAKVERIKGRLRTWQSVEVAELMLPRDAITQGTTIESSSLKAVAWVEDVELQPGNARATGFRLRLSGPAADLYRGYRAQDRLKDGVTAIDANGQNLPLQVLALPGTGAAVDFRVIVTNAAGPLPGRLARLRVRVPTKVKPVDLPFEIRDFDLPAQ